MSMDCLTHTPTRDRTRNPGMWPDQESNQRPPSLWDDPRPTEPHRSGRVLLLLGGPPGPLFSGAGLAVLSLGSQPSCSGPTAVAPAIAPWQPSCPGQAAGLLIPTSGWLNSAPSDPSRNRRLGWSCRTRRVEDSGSTGS